MATASDANDEIDLRDLLGVLIGGKTLLAAVAASVFALGVLYAWLAPRIYSADALVQVEEDRKGFGSTLGEMAELLGTETPVTAELEILKSRMVLGKVVDELSLELRAEPAYFPVIGETLARRFRPAQPGELAGAKLGLRRFAWGGEQIRVTDFVLPDAYYGQVFHVRAGEGGSFQLFDTEDNLLGKGALGQRLSFELEGQSAGIFIQELIAEPGTQFDITRRRQIDVIRDLASRFNVSERGKQSGVLQLSLEDTDRRRAADTLNKIAEVYLRQNVERKSAEAQQTLGFLQEQLPKLRKDVDAAESAINAYRLRQGSADLTKETDLILQQAVSLEQSRLGLEQKREEALRRFTRNHPVVETLNAQLAQLAAERQSIDAKVKDLPQTQQELLRLSRDREVNSALYLSLLNSAQELEVVKAGTVGNVRIIDAALPPSRPSKPKVALILALSLVLGLMAGVAAVFVRRALHSGIEDPAMVENKLGVPTYSVVPYSDSQRRIQRAIIQEVAGIERLLALAEPHGGAVEALRSLRTALHFGQLEARNNILMLTGPSPGLGKSFVSANLAAVLASTGKRVVVLDADLRRGHMHEYFRKERSPGFTDFISGQATMQEIINETQVEGLHFVSTGTIPPNPSELLLAGQVNDALDYLSKHYDTVILDTPPVLAVTDAAILGRLAGTTLLVLKAGEHSLRMIEDSLKRLHSAGIVVRGTIFNQAGITGSGRYGYGYGYGYNYGYYNYNYQPKVQ